MRTYELARRYGVTVEGAVTWAFEFEDQPAFAGFRELATSGIDKPVLNVFRMMGMLGGGTGGDLAKAVWVETESSGAMPLTEVVAKSVAVTPDVSAVATGNGNEIDVLVWNYHDADVAAPDAAIHLSVDGLSGKRINAAEFRMDATHSNAYRAWQQMGSPAHPSAEQTRQLQDAGALDETVKDHPIRIESGKAAVDLMLPRQGVVLVRLLQ